MMLLKNVYFVCLSIINGDFLRLHQRYVYKLATLCPCFFMVRF